MALTMFARIRFGRRALREDQGGGVSEHDQQKMVCEWMRANGVRFFAVPNAGQRSPKTAAWLKAEGMQRGVPDLIILTPPPAMVHLGVAGVAVEMKEHGRRPSIDQHRWLQWFTDSPHWTAAVHYGAGSAIAWLTELGYGQQAEAT